MQIPPVTTVDTSVELPAAPEIIPDVDSPAVNFAKLLNGANTQLLLEPNDAPLSEIKVEAGSDQAQVDEHVDGNPIEINPLFNQIELLNQARLPADAPHEIPQTTDLNVKPATITNKKNSPPEKVTTPALPANAEKIADDEVVLANEMKLSDKFTKPKQTVSDTPQTLASHPGNKEVNQPVDVNVVAPTVMPVTQSLHLTGAPNDKHVQALTQMGEIINSHTAHLSDALPQHSEITETDYVSTAKKVVGNDYETKIELHPETLDSMLKTTYSANIKIYPPELGHVLAKLKVDKDSTQLLIMTENNTVKQIVEASLSQLRDNFQQADINLSSIQVVTSDTQGKSAENSGNNKSNQQLMNQNAAAADAEALASSEKAAARQLNSLVDTYA